MPWPESAVYWVGLLLMAATIVGVAVGLVAGVPITLFSLLCGVLWLNWLF
jgi:hypothetical protein